MESVHPTEMRTDILGKNLCLMAGTMLDKLQNNLNGREINDIKMIFPLTSYCYEL